MKKIELSQNKYTIVDDEDYEYLNQWNWNVIVNKYTNYSVRTDYTNNKRKFIHMHRLIMNYSGNMEIDHINGNGLDNRKENLRICTHSQNIGNSRVSKRNKSGFKGVIWHKRDKNWQSQIRINGRLKYLGSFSDKNDAKDAYTKAAKDHFGEFYSDGIIKKDQEILGDIDSMYKERLPIHNTSGIKGVSWDKSRNRWVAQITINNKKRFLGRFTCIADAKAAYDVAIAGA